MPYIASWEGDDALEQLQRTPELIDALARDASSNHLPDQEGQAERALGLGEAA